MIDQLGISVPRVVGFLYGVVGSFLLECICD